MKKLSEYIHYFVKLRRAPNLGGAPHKPVLLLSIIDAIEKGYIRSERIYITAELIALFKSNWNIWVETSHTMNFALPFYHLSNEPFWKLVVKSEMNIGLTSKNSIKSFQALIQSVDYAEIDKDLFFYLTQVTERDILRKTIIEKYFQDVTPTTISSTYYLDIIAEQILKDSAIQYKKTIKQLQEKGSDEDFEEEIYLRNNVFKQKIPQIYDYTCSITGLRVKSTYGHSLIDACHIIPFSEEHDDTIGNGITLCPNLHRAFDSGLITIDNNYKVIVSRKFSENNSIYSIRQFDNKKLILPQNKLFHPRKEVLEWHNNNIFEKKLYL
ncbi:HNH endonuclease [Bacteroidales bacterium OttesenSCG-928-I14]|nr:HNH endonuclease [Bacteroidales bacterium OttesenSCG-928-I14]